MPIACRLSVRNRSKRVAVVSLWSELGSDVGSGRDVAAVNSSRDSGVPPLPFFLYLENFE